MQGYNMRVGTYALIVKDEYILLIAFEDAMSGFPYNLPGGGIQPGESAQEALQREVHEEASVDIEVGRLLLVTEYEPIHNAEKYGALHKLGLIFECQLKADNVPQLPSQPDPNQIGVQWVPLTELSAAPLLPAIANRLLRAYGQPGVVDSYLPIES